ncbi:class A sortase [Weissella ceti]|uniref:class A sortase n=1 Tax=Weissella ceti TaxID=759620 RepID=UPI001BCBE170|nr:class A sortase [Weissella ceti]QVK11682.1 class A sortase [Weissella ceti]
MKAIGKFFKSKFMRITMFIVLILISLGLIFHNQIAHFALQNFHPEVSKETIAAAEKEDAKYEWRDVQSLSAEQILQARINAGKVNFVGFVAMPEIGLSVPIAHGIDDLVLSLGAGTMYPNQKMGEGNYSLASHFIQGETGKGLMFSPLYYKGKVGQKIYLTDMTNVYEYTATAVETIKSTDVQWTHEVPGKKVITLITCNYTAEAGRVVMQGELTKTYDWEHAPKAAKDSFTADNRWIK